MRRAGRERRLGLAAQKHIAPKTRPVHQRFGGGADRLEAAQAELQRFGKIRGFWFLTFGALAEAKDATSNRQATPP